MGELIPLLAGLAGRGLAARSGAGVVGRTAAFMVGRSAGQGLADHSNNSQPQQPQQY